ncbi:MAG: carbohydrate ABC transporter permease [Clostridia bacterium]|nr:carbohydrate ABC transporter permease [Clostridia bacterium]MBQ2433880.1 carbohydrate ABC transporter permease [Clostridia bacterium]MBQ5771117.1 carbohydrate ABC transporter permease [Clostridia bacterium]
MAKNAKMLKAKRILLGGLVELGLVQKILLYVMLISLCFVYVYPILHMAVTSLKSLTDLLDPSVQWLPHEITIENYTKALDVMGFAEHFLDTLLVTIVPALAQTFSCALAGYAFARFHFKGRNLLMMCVLLTFIVPFPVLMVPTYTLYADYGILSSIWTMILPAITGQGLRAAIFILIYRATYEQIPFSLDEAARVDGASEARVFFTIGIPLGLPAMITSFLFSFVWYWNETYTTSLFMGNAAFGHTKSISTLVMELSKFEESYLAYLEKVGGWASRNSGANVQNEAVTMAGTILTIAPLLIVYFCLQRYFTEAIDRSGITGE